jgi:hypothetical protein
MLAMAYPEPINKGGRGHTKPLELREVHSGDLSRARVICKWAPEWIDEILAQPRRRRWLIFVLLLIALGGGTLAAAEYEALIDMDDRGEMDGE